MWGFPEIGLPPVIIHFSGIFYYKPNHFGVPHFRKLPSGKVREFVGEFLDLQGVHPSEWIKQPKLKLAVSSQVSKKVIRWSPPLFPGAAVPFCHPCPCFKRVAPRQRSAAAAPLLRGRSARPQPTADSPEPSTGRGVNRCQPQGMADLMGSQQDEQGPNRVKLFQVGIWEYLCLTKCLDLLIHDLLIMLRSGNLLKLILRSDVCYLVYTFETNPHNKKQD